MGASSRALRVKSFVVDMVGLDLQWCANSNRVLALGRLVGTTVA
jgi:hypothetical protein